MADILPIPETASKRKRRLRLIGLAVLLLGIAGAGAVYWLGTRSPDVMDDPSMAGFYKAKTRQMGELYGNMGLQFEELLEEMKQPATQAKVIVTISVLVAGGCFYLASLVDDGDEQPDA